LPAAIVVHTPRLVSFIVLHGSELVTHAHVGAAAQLDGGAQQNGAEHGGPASPPQDMPWQGSTQTSPAAHIEPPHVVPPPEAVPALLPQPKKIIPRRQIQALMTRLAALPRLGSAGGG
jgi:hypothetical protein